MANKKVPTEGGNARGHSNMAHSLHTDEIKTSARKARRRADRAEVDAEARKPTKSKKHAIGEEPFRYRVHVEWSHEDACYIARVSALAACAARGDTFHGAAEQACLAADEMLGIAREDGDAFPHSDVAYFYGPKSANLTDEQRKAIDAQAEPSAASLRAIPEVDFERAAVSGRGELGMQAVRWHMRVRRDRRGS
jgi:predicted RNase H-like HicB family nuclease